MPICVAVSASTGWAADRDVGALRAVRVDELAVVHPVEMIAGEDQVVLRRVLREVPGRLPTASAVP
jgi:hypothetical protein